MGKETVSRHVYIREIYNLQCITDPKPQHLGRGMKLTPVPNDIAELIDSRVPQVGGRWANIQSWMIEAVPASKANWIDGDPAGGLRVLPIAMVITVSPRLKFGPSIFLEIENNDKRIAVQLYDQIHTLWRAHCKPDDFRIDSATIEDLRRTFKQLINHWGETILIIPLDRFVRACSDKRADDAIIDLSVALEYLYVDGKEAKGENIARRGACLVGTNVQERERTYVDLRAFYCARNLILHEGIPSPSLRLKHGRILGADYWRDTGFSHLATAFKKMLGDPKLASKTKKEFVGELKKYQTTLKTEFDAYHQKFKCSPV